MGVFGRYAKGFVPNRENAGRYNMDGRMIFKIGANFSSKEKNLTDWKVEEVK